MKIELVSAMCLDGDYFLEKYPAQRRHKDDHEILDSGILERQKCRASSITAVPHFFLVEREQRSVVKNNNHSSGRVLYIPAGRGQAQT